jgi:glucokinase
MAGSEFIAVDLGGTHLRTALVRKYKIVKYLKKGTPKKQKDLLQELTDSISQMMTPNVKGIGVASPGPLKDGIIYNTPNLPFKTFDLKKFLKKKFKTKVEVVNDADSVAIAEAKLGCRRKHIVVFTLGTGIGGGIIMNNELFRGAGYGGEIGHVIIDGGRDMEDLWKDHRRLSEIYYGEIKLVNDLFKIKDKKARQILEKTAKYLGQGIASIINILDPEMIILSGGVKETGNKFMKMIRKNTYLHVIIPKKTPIKWTSLAHPGILGAAWSVENAKK